MCRRETEFRGPELKRHLGFSIFRHHFRKGLNKVFRNPVFVVALTQVSIGVVGCLLPSRLNADVTQWWSADLQPTTRGTGPGPSPAAPATCGTC